MNNPYTCVTNLLDKTAPLKKLSKKDIELKSKPWINHKIHSLMKKWIKLLTVDKNSVHAREIHIEYKHKRNDLRKMKSQSKINYYNNSFEANKCPPYGNV